MRETVTHTAAQASRELESLAREIRAAITATAEAHYREARYVEASTEEIAAVRRVAWHEHRDLAAEATAAMWRRFYDLASVTTGTAAELEDALGAVEIPAPAACWCGERAFGIEPVDPTITPANATLSDGQPGQYVCVEHVGRDGSELLGANRG